MMKGQTVCDAHIGTLRNRCYFKDAKKASEPKMKLVISGCQIVTYPQDAIGTTSISTTWRSYSCAGCADDHMMNTGRAGAAFGVIPAPGTGGRSAIRGGKRKVYVFNAPNETERDLWYT